MKILHKPPRDGPTTFREIVALDTSRNEVGPFLPLGARLN